MWNPLGQVGYVVEWASAAFETVIKRTKDTPGFRLHTMAVLYQPETGRVFLRCRLPTSSLVGTSFREMESTFNFQAYLCAASLVRRGVKMDLCPLCQL